MTLLNNPFVTSGYIAPEYFCDRERETEELLRWLVNENNVAIPGFGTFEGVKHDESVVRDLTSGRNMLLPPSIELQFKPGGMLRKKVKEVQK